MVEHPLWERKVVGSNPGHAIPKVLKMVPVAMLGAQHYKASTGSSSNKYRTTNIATLTKRSIQKECKKKSLIQCNNQCLYSSEDRMEDWQSC